MNNETGKAFEDLVAIVARLRGPGGCPWDREQTHDSLKKCLIEETYEVVDALDAHDMYELRGELGDLLLQIVFHAELASETEQFDIKDVIEAISEKLIRRHPHVFGETSVKDADEVVVRWEEIKSGEKGFEHRKSVLDGVPNTLPSLSRAMKISKRAAKVGFEWPTIEAVFEKMDEEIAELKHEVEHGTPERTSEEIGDLLFTVVNIARWSDVDPEDALRQMTKRFAHRFRKIEEVAKAEGRSVEDMTIEEMDAVWNRAKEEI
jgi:MazG family protein